MYDWSIQMNLGGRFVQVVVRVALIVRLNVQCPYTRQDRSDKERCLEWCRYTLK